jgi:3-oxoacyl-[acyl-carrier protein] reductase
VTGSRAAHQPARPVALVTGAAGGIGRAVALAFAKAGYDVGLNHLNTAEAADQLAGEIRRLGAQACVINAAVGDETAVTDMFAVVDAAFGRLDVLVNNAGIARAEDIFDTTLQSWNEVLRTNLTGPFLCAKAAMQRMRSQRSGVILQMSSVVGHQGALLGHVHYGATKAGLIGLTKSLARKAAPLGIRVNAVAPGIVDTPMLHATHGEAGIGQLKTRVPLGTLATPEDVAAAVLFLASDAARHITGTVLDVNGGMLMR